MGFVEKIDLAILDGFYQRVADWMQHTYGKSCFWLARIFCWLVLGATAVLILRVFFFGSTMYENSLILPLLAPVFLTFSFMVRIKKLEDEERSETNLRALRVMNPRRLFFPYGLARMFILGSVSVLIMFGLFKGTPTVPGWPLGMEIGLCILFIISFVSAEYFSACTPKPQSPVKAGNEIAARAVPSRT